MAKKLTYLDVLEETIKYYGEDLSRRSLNTSEKYCEYITVEGNMCAVGRCLQNPNELSRCNHLNVIRVSAEIGRTSLIAMLKPEYQHLIDIGFWSKLQLLHDSSENWSEELRGLSGIGELEVENIKDYIKKYLTEA